MKRKKESNKLNILFFLFLFLFWGDNSFAQYSIKYEDDALTKRELISLQKIIDYQLEFYNKVFPDSMLEQSSVNLTIYNNYAGYLVYQKKLGSFRHNSMGFYSPVKKEAVVCKDKYEKYFLKTCYHELSHFFILNYMSMPPVWLNEGLAEYFGNMKVSKSVKEERNNYRIGRVKTMIELRDINLKDFIGWKPDKFYDISFTQDGYGYALAYCMILFLMQNEESMIAVIDAVYKGKDSYEALDNSYGGGFALFEKEFMSFVMRDARK